jgi:hypothetical protein
MIRLVLSVMVMTFFIAVAWSFGDYAQLYSTVPSDAYATVYYEYTSPANQYIMKAAAEYRCEGQLEEDFSCSMPGDAGYEKGQ